MLFKFIHPFGTLIIQIDVDRLYRGNPTLTLFELILLWISYREVFIQPDVKFVRLPENHSILKLSRLFSFDS